ncbi:PACE efflux transporter [Photobacterium sagamiensis]|uniref:PACE efflux transporter n=1 Tax=Photobacterium sagamiensis TaxID=2910241 RepID=UPI003D1100C4
MSTKERLLHSLLFEIIALTLLVGISQLFTEHNPATVSGLAITLSLIAMAWNYFYNLAFDKVFSANRLSRGLLMRIGHGIGFEIGLLIVTIPLLMWVLKLDFWTVLILDLGLAAFFLIYAITFNWSYDNVREKFKSSRCVA